MPVHGDMDIAPPFLKEMCKQLGIDLGDVLWEADMIYPATLTEDHETGQVMVRLEDVPEAMAVGRDREEALARAEDALLVALSGYIADGRVIPAPSKPDAGQPVVTLPVLRSAKLAIYEAMRLQGITQLALSHKLGMDPRQIRRMLDLDHNSRMDQVEAALRALGRRLVVTVREAA